MAITERLLTVKEVAEILRVSGQWVRAHANGSRRPVLKCVRLGKSVRFREADVQTLIDECNTMLEWQGK